MSRGAASGSYRVVGENSGESVIGDDGGGVFCGGEQLRLGRSPSPAKRTRAVNPGPGSFRVLAWVGRLGVAGVEPLALALGLSLRTAYSHISRLEKVGLVW